MDNEKRLDKLEDRVNNLENNMSDVKADIKINNNQTNQILEIVKKLQSSIEKLKEENVENRNVVVKEKASYWDKILFAILGGIGTYLLSLLIK